MCVYIYIFSLLSCCFSSGSRLPATESILFDACPIAWLKRSRLPEQTPGDREPHHRNHRQTWLCGSGPAARLGTRAGDTAPLPKGTTGEAGGAGDSSAVSPDPVPPGDRVPAPCAEIL